MKRIGTTVNGTVIVELTQDEFDSLNLTLVPPKPVTVPKVEASVIPQAIVPPKPVTVPKVEDSVIPQPIVPPKAAAPCAANMTVKEIAEHVKPRLAKLTPKKKATLINSIAAMFQFTGGIEPGKMEQVFRELVKSRFMSESDGHITYL